MTLARGVIAPADPATGHALVAAGLDDGLRVTAAVVGSTVVGAAISHRIGSSDGWALLALGVAPDRRRRGLAGRLLRAHIDDLAPDGGVLQAEVTVAERDPFDPLDGSLRRSIARRLFSTNGFAIGDLTDPRMRAADPGGLSADRPMWAGVMSDGALDGLPAEDIVDVRLIEAMRTPGCPVCAVRARSERATLDAIINERVLDIGFRAELERKHGFCRRHVAALVETDRRETGGILGSSILLGAVVDRRTGDLAAVIGSSGRTVRSRIRAARRRPPCLACSQGATGVETAISRLAERSREAAWVAVLRGSAFCLDDFLALWETAASERGFEPVAESQLARFADLRRRLDGYAYHSSHDRRHLLTDEERTAADEATDALGGDRR